jgi:A/G-specific adenine glycosylase
MKLSTTIMNLPTHDRILAWSDRYGRKNLPWQINKTPYKTWLSEVMLQQTQVATVIPYFNRFMTAFPDIQTLAAAPLDSVLHLWAGLGYYSRARNLHATAKRIVDEYHGMFPQAVQTLHTLPGIGRSTAGAIASLAFNQKAVILDGNVRRLLIRFIGIQAAINSHLEKQLWQHAEALLPNERFADYSQSVMDLGATICTPKNPQCDRCPLALDCKAYHLKIAEQLPIRKPKAALPLYQKRMLIFQFQNFVLVHKRPEKGIWGGLWSLPEMAIDEPLETNLPLTAKGLGLRALKIDKLANFRHTFTHFYLDIHPIWIKVAKKSTKAIAPHQQIWYNLKQNKPIGFPKPIHKILEAINDPSHPLHET